MLQVIPQVVGLVALCAEFTCFHCTKLIHFLTCTGIPCRESHCENGLVRCCLHKITNFHRMGVHHGEHSEPIHCLEPTFLWKALYHHVDWAVTIFLLVCQEFVRRDQVATGSLWRRVCSKHFCFSAVRAVLYDQDSVRVLPIILAATCRTAPVAVLLSVP